MATARPEGLIEFELKDAWGETHDYECSPHPGREGQRIMFVLAGTACRPLLEAMSGIAKSGDLLRTLLASKTGGKGFKLSALLSAEGGAASLLKDMDLSSLGKNIQEAALQVDLAELGEKVLRHTMRDKKPLDQPGVFDRAYQANYLELLQAYAKVVGINRFLPLPGTLIGG